MPMLSVQNKLFQMRPQSEAYGDTATRLPRGYRVALYMSLFLTHNLHQPFGLISTTGAPSLLVVVISAVGGIALPIANRETNR